MNTMLVIRDAQRAAMAQVTDRAFIERIVRYLREHRTDDVAAFDDAQLRAELVERVARARRHALTSERSLACFVAWSFAYGLQFDEHPLVRPILDDVQTPQATRLEMLARSLTRRDWKQVRAAQR